MINDYIENIGKVDKESLIAYELSNLTDAVYKLLDYLKEKEITGEYPCSKCGQPTLYDKEEQNGNMAKS